MKRQRSISPPKGSNKKKATTTTTTTPRTPSAPASGSTPLTRRNSTNSNGSNNKDRVSFTKWKQQQSHDYNTHQFLDASASVHAGLFGARRLPEIKSLWRQVVLDGLLAHTNDLSFGGGTVASSTIGGTGEDPQRVTNEGKGRVREAIRRPGESGGGKISSRHLRRRTNSHQPRRRFRFFPSKNYASNGDGDENDAARKAEVIGNGIVAMEDVNFQGGASSATTVTEQTKPNWNKPPCRRARRKPYLMKASHSTWWEPKTHSQLVQPPTSIDEQNNHSAHNWIATHLWHAKRFHISPKLFDAWSIPLIHCNRGSRASLRLASSETSPKCTIQDATWEVNGCAIAIEVRKIASSSAPTSFSSSDQTLVSILQRLCGTEAPFLKDENVLLGNQAGEGIVHEIDACPQRPISPATFLFGRSTKVDDFETARVGVLIHPAVHQRVVSLLNMIVREDVSPESDVTLSTMPLALLRVRGRASTATVQNVLGQSELIVLDDDANMHGTLIGLGEIPTSLNAPMSYSTSIPNTTTPSRSWIKLKCHRPNQNYQHLPHNLASSGWDIFCHPSISSPIFQSFVVNGGACAVGLAEDARAQLEAYPPLPIFPRDYPDTEDGRLYWNGGANAALVRNEGGDKHRSIARCLDWLVIRTCFEGSWGRINTELKRTIRHWDGHDDQGSNKSKSDSSGSAEMMTVPMLIMNHKLLCRETVAIHWESLTSVNDQYAVVVRGSYGIPFFQLLHGCGKPFLRIATAAESGRKRRPRRTVRPANWAVHASPLSKKEAELHSGLCQQLSSSLSLPALLRCELYFEEKGTLNVGDLIYALDRNDSDENCLEDSELGDAIGVANVNAHSSPLGVVTGGGFSPSRGKCHGIGFVGAAKLINALNGTVHGMSLIIPQSNGHRKMVLKVTVTREASVSRVALLSILL
jgi:hypothetical protein